MLPALVKSTTRGGFSRVRCSVLRHPALSRQHIPVSPRLVRLFVSSQHTCQGAFRLGSLAICSSRVWGAGCPLGKGLEPEVFNAAWKLQYGPWLCYCFWWRDKQNPYSNKVRQGTTTPCRGPENTTHVSKDPAFVSMKNGISRFLHHTSMRKGAQLINIQLRDIWI